MEKELISSVINIVGLAPPNNNPTMETELIDLTEVSPAFGSVVIDADIRQWKQN